MFPIKIKSEEAGALGNKGNLARKVIPFLTSFISHSPQSQKFFLAQLGTHIRASPCNCTIPYYAKNFYIFTFRIYFYLLPETYCRRVSCCLSYTLLVLVYNPTQFSSEAMIPQYFPNTFFLIHFCVT